MADETTMEAPGFRGVLREALVVREPLRLLAAYRTLAVTTTRPRRVITVPGFRSRDSSMAPLRRYLARIGHRPMGWGLGRNAGDVEAIGSRLLERVESAARGIDDTVDLVGWSLGGVLARETARELPEVIGRVVTYGTPVVGAPRFTRAAAAYGPEQIRRIEALIDEREQTPIRVPVTAIYSRNDGVVAWEACIDPYENEVEHVAVRSSHIGMGIDPVVWRVVADRLGIAPSSSSAG